MNSPVPTPENWQEVQQLEDYQPQTVPVRVQGITATFSLPAKRSVMRSFHVPAVGNASNDPPVEVIPGDRRIKRAWVVADTNNPGAIYLGSREQAVLGGKSDTFFYNGSYLLGPLEGFEEPVFAYAQTGSAVNILNVRLEYWAD